MYASRRRRRPVYGNNCIFIFENALGAIQWKRESYLLISFTAAGGFLCLFSVVTGQGLDIASRVWAALMQAWAPIRGLWILIRASLPPLNHRTVSPKRRHAAFLQFFLDRIKFRQYIKCQSCRDVGEMSLRKYPREGHGAEPRQMWAGDCCGEVQGCRSKYECKSALGPCAHQHVCCRTRCANYGDLTILDRCPVCLMSWFSCALDRTQLHYSCSE